MRPHSTQVPGSAAPPALGDRYRIEREIGQGGMATVYLAHDRKHRRPVGIKVLRPEVVRLLGTRRFLQEIEIAARLTHPHILPLLDSGEADGLLYYVMPYIEGESLRQRLRRESRLSAAEAVELAREVGSALDLAHRQGVIHRDIKPENILLSEGHAVVTDFGLALAVHEAAGGDRALTTAGVVLGTPAYMSPEQVSGETELDGRTDVYSLGCVLYEMLAGEPPFRGPAARSAARESLGVAERLRQERRDAPPPVVEAVAAALALAPDDRPATAADFAAMLTGSGRHPATPVATQGAARRRRALLATALAALGLAAGAGLLTRPWSTDAGPARARVVAAVFANRTGDPALDALGSMAADWTTRALARTALAEVVDVGAVYVGGRVASGEPTDPFDLARRNGAGTVVSGSYYRLGDTLFIQAAISDAATGSVLQSVEPVRAAADQPARALELLQQRVMAAVAGVLDTRVAAFTGPPGSPPSYAAYQAFVAGQETYWQGRSAAEAATLFRRAFDADTSFLPAAVWLGFVGANGAGCGLTDSVGAALAPRQEALASFDRLTLELSLARCRNDWHEAFRLASAQAGLRPRSTFALYTAGFFALTSGRARSARDLLRGIRPEHDLGWLSDTGKTVYWRDLTAAEHLLGNYEDELRDAGPLIAAGPSRLTPRMIAARALAGLGRSADALAQLDTVLRLPDDPTVRVSFGLTPGQVCYVIATELLVHGDSAAALAAARRAAGWYGQDPRHLTEGRHERLHYARSLHLLGRFAEAFALSAPRDAADSADLQYAGARGVLAAARGDTALARGAEVRLAALDDPSQLSGAGTQRARIAVALGERARALTLLEEAARRGMARSLFGKDVHSDPFFHPLRGDPRFERVILVDE
jgi:tetratricopeptide (TPR) repeat protein